MLFKNEIRLFEEKEDRQFHRLVISPTGDVSPIHDLYYKEDDVNKMEGIYAIEQVVRSQKVQEDDWVFEGIRTNGAYRFEMYRCMGGRLRSLSISMNLAIIAKLSKLNPDFAEWLCAPERIYEGDLKAASKLFPSNSWHYPTTIRATLATLRNLIPCPELWDGKTILNINELVGSAHKLYRLFTQKAPLLGKLSTKPTIEMDFTQFSELGSYCFEVINNRATVFNGHADTVTSGSDIICIKKVGETRLRNSDVECNIFEISQYHAK